MKVQTSRFGEFVVEEERILCFPAGLIGFPSLTRYVMLDHDRDMPFKWLQSLESGDLAFIVMDPSLVKIDYRVVVSPRDVADLGQATGEDYMLFVILTVPSSDPGRITANLRGPLILNLRTRLGKQLVLREDHPTRYPMFPQDSPNLKHVQRPSPDEAPAERSLILSSK